MADPTPTLTPGAIIAPVSELSGTQNVQCLLGISIVLALTWMLSFFAKEWLQRRRHLRHLAQDQLWEEEEESEGMGDGEEESLACVCVEMGPPSYHASRAGDPPPGYTTTWKEGGGGAC